MDAASAIRALAALEEQGIDVWLDGGWGVDALLGRETVLVDPSGRQVDVHPVTFDADGGGVYEMEAGGDWVYPASGFSGRGSVGERAVRCLSPEVQVLVHSGYELAEKDYRELYLLQMRFDVDLPADLVDHVRAAGADAAD